MLTHDACHVDFFQFFQENSLCQAINKPTRKDAVLDLVFSFIGSDDICDVFVDVPFVNSDHDLVCFSIDIDLSVQCFVNCVSSNSSYSFTRLIMMVLLLNCQRFADQLFLWLVQLFNIFGTNLLSFFFHYLINLFQKFLIPQGNFIIPSLFIKNLLVDVFYGKSSKLILLSIICFDIKSSVTCLQCNLYLFC